MKRRKRITEIKVENEEIYLLRRLQKPTHAWCGKCGAKVRMVTPDEAARAAGVNTRTIYRWIENAKVHYLETPDGKLFICSRALADR